MRTNLLMAAVAMMVLAVAGSQALAAGGLLGVTLAQSGNQVVITSVLPGTSAEEVGIRPGDVLAKVGTVNINSINDALYAKQIAPEGVDVPMVIRTSGGYWYLNARFGGGGTPLFYAPAPRP